MVIGKLFGNVEGNMVLGLLDVGLGFILHQLSELSITQGDSRFILDTLSSPWCSGAVHGCQWVG